MRLPTVKLARRNGRGETETLILNQTAYARDISGYVQAGWKVMSYRHGDAPDSVVDFLRKQDEKEIAREANPNHEASNDAERTYEARQNHQANIRTDDEPENREAIHREVGREVVEGEITAYIEIDWRKMKWFALKPYVKKLTGTEPANKEEAVALMEAHEAAAAKPE